MKAVLMSIQPKWCELIASGKKTIEVRKTKPKFETPFKVYIYCTKGENLWKNKNLPFIAYNRIIDDLPEHLLNGKVIGEFVCDKIDGFHYGIQTPDDATSWQDCYEGYPEELYNMDETYLSSKEINDYGNKKFLFTWHISNLVIYDKPKELRDFKKINRDCWYANLGLAKRDCPECKNEGCFITRPPQSWCYVEQLHGKE